MSAADLPADFFNRPLSEVDPEIAEVLALELERQQRTLEMIASENFVPMAVLECQGSVLTNKYAEGYPGKRYYGGCEYVDVAERLAIKRAVELFGAEHANVQPHSGAQANIAVYHALLNPGDTVMGLELSHGGHLTHGMRINVSGRLYDIAPYHVDRDTGRIDMDEVERIAHERRPKMILAGWSAYPRFLDFERFRAIADEVGAHLVVDMAHFAGLVAAGLHPNPVPYADVVTTTIHKTIGGGRGGMILCTEELAKRIDSAVFPGQQGGPLEHVIAGKAVALRIAASRGVPRASGAHGRRRAGGRRRAARRRRRRERADRRHRRAPGAVRPARVRARRQAGRGPSRVGRDHREPERGPVRPAAAGRLERAADRDAGARHPRAPARGLRRGRVDHRRDARQPDGVRAAPRRAAERAAAIADRYPLYTRLGAPAIV